MNCCDTITDLGCFDVCADVSTGVLTDATGTHILEIRFMSITLKKELSLTSGDEIELPKIYLNENSEILFSVKKPDGTYLNDTAYSITTKACLNVV